MRVRLEEMGVPVMITGAPSMDNLEAHLERVDEMASWAGDRGFEAVFINTATALTFHGAEIAAALQIPVVWAIHESFEPSRLWAGLHRSIRRRAEAALGESSAVVFEADATRALFESKVGEGRAATLPYGLDLGPIDSRRARFDRDAERREAQIPPDADVVLCVGTIEPRKGQVALAQAFNLIADRHPRARLVFVGGRNDQQTRVLTGYIDSCAAADQIEVVPVTPDVQRWHGISDLFVSASDIESLPRTVLEAMAWERPVLAAAVFGLPELIDDGETGWLCAPLDVSALSAALDRVLGTPPEVRARIAAAARALVEERHSLPRYAAEVAELLDRAVAEPLAEPRRRVVGE
jgi:glycosyltransferase involved in cell wall biosynthesis